VKQSTRKLIGTVGLMVSLIGYCGLVIWAYDALFTAQPWWVLIGFFAIAGLLWAVPAGWLILWMARPDRPR
jgi:RsiW-degrading membrane proteinase PrsW (M82 family)